MSLSSDWRKEYLLERSWLRDSTLITDNGTKICKCCGKNFYSVEFPNYPDYPDRKIPVCVSCFRSKKLAQKRRDILRLQKVCKRCKKQKAIADFGYQKQGNTINSICKKCNSKKLQKVFGRD